MLVSAPIKSDSFGAAIARRDADCARVLDACVAVSDGRGHFDADDVTFPEDWRNTYAYSVWQALFDDGAVRRVNDYPDPEKWGLRADPTGDHARSIVRHARGC